tara:strand:+ start:2600 stop:3913 length:1314 start_codon:yes stop_codon:yes gene_type:complete
MASIKFLIQGKNSPANIYVQLSVGRGKVFKRKTGYSIDPKDWGKKGMPIDRDTSLKNLKADLNKLSSNLENCLNDAVSLKEVVNGDWLQLQINIINGQVIGDEKEKLTNHIQYIIDNAHRVKKANNQIGLSQSRIKSYKLFKNVISRFEKEINKGQSFFIRDVGFDFGEQFSEWLFSKKYSINYVGKNIDNLKAVCRDAERRGIETSTQLKRISSFTKQTNSDEVIILSESEQESIADLKLTREALINARKWLLLGCQLGQRFSDLIRITPDMIKASNGIKIIELTQIKTSKLVAIPLMPKAIEIIENGMPYPIALQNFNEYIKDICREAGFNQPTKGSAYIETEEKSKNKPKTPGIYPKWKLIGSHVCRRSFASNLYGKIPTALLINITGHGTEKMFLKYIGRTAYDNAYQMMEYFGKLQAKEKKEAQMQVLKNAN